VASRKRDSQSSWGAPRERDFELNTDGSEPPVGGPPPSPEPAELCETKVHIWAHRSTEKRNQHLKTDAPDQVSILCICCML